MMTKLDICDRSCWCYYCRNAICKGEQYIDIRKKAQRGYARINICSRCLDIFAKQVTKKDIQAVENRIVLEELEKTSSSKCPDCYGFCNFGEYPNCKIARGLK